VKTAVSIPDPLFKEADKLAARLGKSRSELFADALREHLLRHGDAAITARLDAVYSDLEPSEEDRVRLDAVAAEMARDNRW
jgi:metal-responsive CopG/Arc/MetJ family transcriptional regulator